MLYAGDRKDASETISSWLGNGSIVLLDRYTYSNIAYQCAKLENHEQQKKLMRWILDLEFRHFGIPRPDLNIFLDVPASFTKSRLKAARKGEDRRYLNGTDDIHESSLAFQNKVREMYLRIADDDEKMCVIDCSDRGNNILPPQQIFNLIIKYITDQNAVLR